MSELQKAEYFSAHLPLLLAVVMFGIVVIILSYNPKKKQP